MLLDIAIGILLALGTSSYFEFYPSGEWILLGICFALLPDIDVFYEMYKRGGKLAGKELGGHREWTHYPLLYPPVVLLVGFIWGKEVGMLMGLGLVWHILHDLSWTGWGIAVFGPFSKRYFKFFANQDGSLTVSRLVASWDKEELREVVRIYDRDDWLKATYLRPTITSVIELAALIAAIGYLIHFR